MQRCAAPLVTNLLNICLGHGIKIGMDLCECDAVSLTNASTIATPAFGRSRSSSTIALHLHNRFNIHLVKFQTAT